MTPAEAWALFEHLRWGEGAPVCPHCGHPGRCTRLPAARVRAGRAPSARPVWRCGACRQQFSVLTGTVFAGTRVPLPAWVGIVDACCADPSPSAREVGRRLGLGAATAGRALARARAAGVARGAAPHDELARVLRLPGDAVRGVRTVDRPRRERFGGAGVEYR